MVFGRWCRFFEWMWSAAARGEDVEWGSDEWRGIEWRGCSRGGSFDWGNSYVSIPEVYAYSSETVCRMRAY